PTIFARKPSRGRKRIPKTRAYPKRSTSPYARRATARQTKRPQITPKHASSSSIRSTRRVSGPRSRSIGTKLALTTAEVSAVRCLTILLLAGAAAAIAFDTVPKAYTESPLIRGGQFTLWHDP